MQCRFCGQELSQEFLDLGASPPSNAFLTQAALQEPEVFYPLRLLVCGQCFLVQVDEVRASGELFSADYVYYSSFSTTWLAHAKGYVDMIAERLALTARSRVVELAANDGYLLQYVQAKGIPCYGVEPCLGVARAAQDKGLKIVTEFFGEGLGRRLAAQGQADLVIGNNVLAHVPDIRDFVAGVKALLAPSGTATFEFPHLLRLVAENQFDTVYHEHYSYFSFTTLGRIFQDAGLTLFDVEELPTHGGSLRVYASHGQAPTARAEELLAREAALGMTTLDYYRAFQERADRVKNELLTFLLAQQASGKRVAAYGAAAKGNTLLNYAGVRRDLVAFVVDASPHKQGRFLPGSRIPVVHEDELRKARPDFILVLPWNLKAEIETQLAYVRQWGGRFVIPIPSLTVE